MNAHRVNVLNIGLMLAAWAAAWVLPFELFLLAYALLGPLHYLTQISWLHQHDYFAGRRRDAWGLFALCGVFLLLEWGSPEEQMRVWAPLLNGLALGTAAALVFCRDRLSRGAVLVACAAAALLVADTKSGHDWLRIFLPTLVHVSLFTGAFMLYGALKGRSTSGLWSVGVFVACSVSFFVLPRVPLEASPDPTVVANYSSFWVVNQAAAEWLGFGGLTSLADMFQSAAGVTIMRFIAFAYTYHYLNWFSKTSVIQWHRIPRAWALVNVVLWLASVALYLHDYRTGLVALFALSFLHVYLELPLDHRAFAGIGSELRAIRRHGWRRG